MEKIYKKIIIRVSYDWPTKDIVRKIEKELKKDNKVEMLKGSMGITECQVACGRCYGSISLNKDSFPHFASSIIVQEAGGIYTNVKEEDNIKFEDRIFVGGNKNIQPEILKVVNKYYK